MRKFYTLSILCLFSILIQAQSQQKPDNNLKNILRENAATLKLSTADIDGAIISSAYTDPKSKIEYVYLQQAWQNIKVYNSIMTIILRDNKLLYSAGKFVDKIDSKAGMVSPGIQADGAIIRSAEHLQLNIPLGLKKVEDRFAAEKKIIFSPAGIAKSNIETELYWVASDDGSSVKLAWNVNIDVLHSTDWWNIRVDASTGQFIAKNNWTVYDDFERGDKKINTNYYQNRVLARKDEPAKQFKLFSPPGVTQAAYYVVPFPYESPNHHSLVTENEPWLKSGVGNQAITDGWQYDGSTDYTITRGNNTFAYLDVANSNVPNATVNWPDTSTTPVPSLSFNFIPNFSLQPSTVTNKRTALANLFYWNNLMHDVYYQYGFNEVAGNFQTDNLGRGGIGNDYVQAEGQDGGGTNNANFATPVDGQRPRMQMYLWSAAGALFTVNSPAAIAGSYAAIEGVFSTNNLLINVGPVTGQVIYYNDNSGGLHEGCVPPSNTLTGKIAMIDRNTCNFTVKVKNAQDAGAIAVIVVNNIPGAPALMGGTDNTIVIPAVMISQSDGALIAAQLASGVNITLAAGVNIDGDLDNGVVCHEFGHGISNRCTGGPGNSSCLGNTEQGGEGWSDYMALMMTTNWATATINDGPIPRPMGTYAAGQPINGPGIRTYPYSTNIAVNPLVYSATLPAEPHSLGEYWCMALWEMTWEMIQVDGINPNIFNASGTGGNSAAMKLLVEGMKLQPCGPGFIDARNAILKADTLFFAAHYSCAIWKAFAKRGMGRNASEGSPNSVTDQTPDFSLGYAAISGQPSNVSVCTGGNANFSVTATGATLTYQWQVSTNGGSSFSNISGATTSSLALNAVTIALNNNQYHCIVVASCGPSVTSSAAVLTVASGPSITSQPSSQTVCSGTNAIFTITVSGPASGYQWQVSTNGGSSFTDISGATTASLTLTAVTTTQNNNQYHCVVSASCGGGLTSNAATLTVNASAIINTQPANAAVCIGNNATFSVTSTGATAYQWQISTNGGSSFSNIAGETASTLVITGVTAAMNNNQYRCVVNGSCGSTTTNAAVLTVFAPPVITVQPSNTTVCAASNASFSITATGPIVGYQWQVSIDGGATYININGATTTSLTLNAVTTAQNNNRYRCAVTGNCVTINSNGGILTINPLPSFTLVNIPSSLCVSDTAITLNASLTGGVWSGAGVQGTKFSPSVAGVGTFAVTYTVTNNFGCTLALSSSIQVNACPERHVLLSADNSLVIYPNPSSGLFTVKIHSDLYTKLGLRVYNSNGQLIKTQSFTGLLYNAVFPVDLSKVSGGLYHLFFYNDESGKLVKKTFGIVIAR